VAPQHYFAVRNGVGWNDNLAGAQALATRMGLALEPDAPLEFPAGSMFWARSAALRPLLDLGLSVEDFEPEAGQEDATVAHAVERLYFHACEQAGYRWIKIGRPELTRAGAGPATPIAGPGDLDRLIEITPRLRPDWRC
jgi:lipopolysaccharide biosynthesis protein